MATFSVRLLGVGAAIGLLAAGGAKAAVVEFDNSAGVFTWALRDLMNPQPIGHFYLDVTAAPNAQPTSPIAQRTYDLPLLLPRPNLQPGSVAMAGLGLTRGDTIQHGSVSGRPPSAGLLSRIGPWADFASGASVAFLQDPSGLMPPSRLYASEGYVGLRLTIAGQSHYGWVYIQPAITSPPIWSAVVTVRPVRWAYETRPNTPIVIPGRCMADLDSDGSFANGGTPDAAVTIEDLLFMLAAFEAGDLQADVDDDGEPAAGAPDGAVTIEDLLFFLARFEQGC